MCLLRIACPLSILLVVPGVRVSRRPTGAFQNAGNKQPAAQLFKKARISGNNFGKVLRNIALALRLQIRPGVNSPEGLKFLESMLHMLTSVYASIAERVSQLQANSWASGFLDGMRYQLKRMLAVLLECLQNSNTPKRFWVRTLWSSPSEAPNETVRPISKKFVR